MHHRLAMSNTVMEIRLSLHSRPVPTFMAVHHRQQQTACTRRTAQVSCCLSSRSHIMRPASSFHRMQGFNNASAAAMQGVPLQAAGRAASLLLRAAASNSQPVTVSTAASPALVKQGTPLRSAQLAPHYDAVVIGSGIGGLAAAVSLAKFAGKRVLVLEQHYTAGGFTHAFTRGPYAWNVGVHYIGGGIGVRGGDMFPAFAALSDGRVPWAQLPAAYDRIIIGDRPYDLVAGRAAWLEQLTSYFPKEHKALEQVLQLIDKAESSFKSWLVAKSLPAWLSGLTAPWATSAWLDLAGQTTTQLLEQITQDAELRAVLAGQWVDVGLPPGSCSAAYQLVLMGHYLEGGYVPVGGASSIAAAMVPIIDAAGGAVVTSADVTEVLVTDGRASGVKLATGEEITCDMVISNAGLINTYTHLLSPSSLAESKPAIQQQLAAAQAIGSSLSAAVLYIGLKGSTVPEFQGLGNIHKHLSTDLDGDLARSFADPGAPLPSVFMSCCDSREQLSHAGSSGDSSSSGSSGSSGSSDGYSTLQVATAVPYDWFERWSGTAFHKRGDDYTAFKQQLQDRLEAELDAVFPGLRSRIAYSELSTPLSTEHFSRWSRGAMYGINATPAKFKAGGGLGFGPRTPIKGLYLTGQDVAGDGVVAAMMAGVVCAGAAGGPGVLVGWQNEAKKWA